MPSIHYNKLLHEVKQDHYFGEWMMSRLTLHLLQAVWMTAAALCHLWTTRLTSHDRTAAGDTTRVIQALAQGALNTLPVQCGTFLCVKR